MAKKTSRDDELSTRPKIKKRLIEVYSEIDKGFQDNRDRTDDQLDWWELYNCKLGEKQAYNGNAKIFVPIVHDALNARKTRFTNQIFPKSGRYVEVITENGDIPHAETALLEHYIRRAKLRTLVAPSLVKNGDIEGQYNVYVSWEQRERHVVWKETRPLRVDGMEVPGIDEIDDIEEDDITDHGPHVEVLSDADVLILPVTMDCVEEAIEGGGSVTILRRWSKGKLRREIDEGNVHEEIGEDLLKELNKKDPPGRGDIRKAHADAAGIKTGEGGKFLLVYETWIKLKVDGTYRTCRVYFGGEKKILGCKLNPYWCDRVPLISVPVEKVAGMAKGTSLVKPCAPIQYYANDIINEAADSATYSMLPIILTDPEKNPRVGTMVLDLAAVWETSPKDTQFAKFPEIWASGFQIVAEAKNQIFQTLSVNPAMIPNQSGSRAKKLSQAEIANEQSVDILTTADAVTVLEEGIFTPIIERFAEYDAQFRNEDLIVRQFGRMGLMAKMEKIPPLQMGKRYEFRWFGVEQARNAAQMQQQIAGINVLRGIPPTMYKNHSIDLTVPIEHMLENLFGPRIAPLVFRDLRQDMSIPADFENQMLQEGWDWPVSPFDNHPEHIQEHTQAMREGDPQGLIKTHIIKHQIELAKAMQAQQQQGQPGTPGGGQPGIAGVPRPGGQPGQPRNVKQSPGAIRPDAMPMAGATPMPRKM